MTERTYKTVTLDLREVLVGRTSVEIDVDRFRKVTGMDLAEADAYDVWDFVGRLWPEISENIYWHGEESTVKFVDEKEQA